MFEIVLRGGNGSDPSWKIETGSAKSLSRCSPSSRKSPSTQGARVSGDEYLPAVGGGADTCRFVHVVPDVALRAQVRCTRMDTDTDVYRAGRQVLEALLGRRDRVQRRRKGDEERVSLGVDLDASVTGERLAQDPPVLLERLGIGRRPEIVQERGRALDIREEERDRASREVAARHRSELATRIQPARMVGTASDPGSRSEHAIVPGAVSAIPGRLEVSPTYNDRWRGWPVRPHDQQHPIRGSFLDPRPDLERGAVYHDGVDIAVRDDRPERGAPSGRTHRVYAVEGGPVFLATPRGVRGFAHIGHFGYGHIDALVATGESVTPGQHIGWTFEGDWHVHLSEFVFASDGSRLPVNPLRPGESCGRTSTGRRLGFARFASIHPRLRPGNDVRTRASPSFRLRGRD